MADFTGMIGSGAPQASSSYGLDPAFLAQLQAQMQQGQSSLSQAAATPSPQDLAAAQQAQAQQSGPPQVKPGALDYLMGALFQHQSPMDVNEQANASNQRAMMMRQQMQNQIGALQAYQQTWGNGGGGQPQQAPQGAPDASGGAQGSTLAPMGMIGSGAPRTPTLGVNGGSFSGVPTVGRIAPLIGLIGMQNPDLAKTLLEATKDAQPSYQIVNGRRVITNDASAPSNIMPADDGTTGYVPNASSPLGYSAVATPNAAAIKASAAALTDYAKGQVAAPMAGAQSTGLSFDPVTGLPKAAGFAMAPGAGNIIAQDAGVKAGAEAGAKAQYDFFGQPTDGQGNPYQGSKYQAAHGGAGSGLPTFGPNAAKLGYDADRQKSGAKELDDINSDGADAQQTVQSLQGLRSLYSQAQTGKLAGAGYDIAAKAKALGLPGNWDNVANKEAIGALSGSLMGGVRKQLGMQRMTDADLKVINANLPSYENSPQGNSKMIDIMEKLANRRVVRTAMANGHAQAYGSLANANARNEPNFDAGYASWAARHPVFGGGL